MTASPKLHHNNFGVLRLLLAIAVIVSHSPQMLDGNSTREPLSALGSDETIGGLAVEGFFIISGYLIAGSYLSSQSLTKFLTSRILRIYPAFLVACVICILIVAPIAGGTITSVSLKGWLVEIAKLCSLSSPAVPGAFRSLAYPALDGSMWTIRYEFRCYMIVALLGFLGLLQCRKMILVITGALYGAVIYLVVVGDPSIPPGLFHQFVFNIIGDPFEASYLTAIFMSGVCARLYREMLYFQASSLVPAFMICAAAVLFLPQPFPILAVGTAGVYVLLWAAVGLKSLTLRSINSSYDFSYGIYLYAWPIASLIIFAAQKINWPVAPSILTILTAIFATLVAMPSWYLIEKPILNLKRRR